MAGRSTHVLGLIAAIMLVGGALLAVYTSAQFRPEAYIRTAPLRTEMTKKSDGTISSTCVTYRKGDYAIAEFGQIRLAVKGATVDVETWGELTISGDGNLLRSGGYLGDHIGAGQLTRWEIFGGSQCTFAGVSFEITNGILRLDGRELDAVTTPTVIIMNQARIDSVQPIH